jgi:hypothetical protein
LIKDTESRTLFGLPNLEYRGVTTATLAALSPGATWSMDVTSDQPPALTLFSVVTGLPVMRMDQDVQARQLSFNFGPDGRYAIVGRTDGTVSLLDLPEVNRHLTKLNLGW